MDRTPNAIVPLCYWNGRRAHLTYHVILYDFFLWDYVKVLVCFVTSHMCKEDSRRVSLRLWRLLHKTYQGADLEIHYRLDIAASQAEYKFNSCTNFGTFYITISDFLYHPVKWITLYSYLDYFILVFYWFGLSWNYWAVVKSWINHFNRSKCD